MNHHPPPHLPQVRPPISNNGPHQINRMQPAMRNIVLECIILEPLDFKPKMDGMAIGTYRVADETGSIFMTVKLDPSDQLKAGDIVRFQDCEVKAPGNRFNIQINATRGNNRFKRIGSDTKIYHELPYWTESEWYWDPQLQHMVLNSGSGPMSQLPGGPGGPGGPNLQNQQRMQGNNMQPAINPAFQNNQRPGPGPMHGPRPPFQGGNLHGNAPPGGPGMGPGGPGMGPNGPGMGKGGPGMRQGGPGMGQGGPNMGQGMGPSMGPGMGPNMAPMPRPGPHSNGYRPGHQGPPHSNGHQGPPPPPHQGPSLHHNGRPIGNNNNINNNIINNNNNNNMNNGNINSNGGNNGNNINNNGGGQVSAHPSLPPPPARKFKKPKVHRDLDAPDSQPNPRSGLASSVDEFARDMKIVAQGGVGLGVDGAGKNKKRL
ncbi:hypothetical protein BGX24_008419 [Mortierella sp. AD032]|nr:hypothetical protein BGX24_008419 [Mortierella sp. AD032]